LQAWNEQGDDILMDGREEIISASYEPGDESFHKHQEREEIVE
jgi:hypothetical protein